MKLEGIWSWRRLCVGLAGLGIAGCATVQPFVPSDAQRARFDETVRAAQSSAGEGPHQVTTMLAEAKSEFEYAQHLPKYPERARALAEKAQRDAEAALRVAHAFVRPAPPPVLTPATLMPPPPPAPPAVPVAAAAPAPAAGQAPAAGIDDAAAANGGLTITE
ncbi:MAG TPA: hypothetical protein VHM31_20660 [Polyangia bacterium]|nr:hypothetical protein [Polyangia bacterium]